MNRTLGAILAGGQSRRFGKDKALALLDGRPLIERAIGAIIEQVSEIVIVGRNGDSGIADRPQPGLGPLGGLNAALHHARENGFDTVVTIGCDMPFLPRDLVAQLQATGVPSFLQSMPIVGYWPASLADRLDAHLAAHTDRSMRHWAKAAGAVALHLPIVLPNINTPADLAALSGTGLG